MKLIAAMAILGFSVVGAAAADAELACRGQFLGADNVTAELPFNLRVDYQQKSVTIVFERRPLPRGLETAEHLVIIEQNPTELTIAQMGPGAKTRIFGMVSRTTLDAHFTFHRAPAGALNGTCTLRRQQF